MANNNEKKASQAVWGSTPAGTAFAEEHPIGSRAFFDAVLHKRSTYEQPWLFDLIPFQATRGKAVLELGCGAGYDAYEFCRNGADYVGLDITPQNPSRTRQHLNHYELNPQVLQGDAENLMFPDQSFDVVFSNGVLHHTPDIRRSFEEAYRVLKPSGEFWVIVYNKHSIFHWVSVFLVGYILKGGFLKRSYQEQLSMIEYTTTGETPLVKVYSQSQIHSLLTKTGFTVQTIDVSTWYKEEVPLIRHFLPDDTVQRIGDRFGWYLICKASK